MLDIKFIRENPKLVEEKAKQKGYQIDIQKLLKVDEERRKLIEEVDKLRSDRKKAAEARNTNQGQALKAKTRELEDKLVKLQEEFYDRIRQVPNLAKDDVLVGKDETNNEVVREVGKKPKFNFRAKDHLNLGTALDLLDVERASKVSGTRFSYIKNELVSLEFALISLALDLLNKEGFIQIIPPVIISNKAAQGLGYPEYERGEGYKVEDQYLVGTAEHSIVPMHMDETFKAVDLPRRYGAFSTSFRREAGSYGKDTKGIFRVHQFDKIEMVSFIKPEDDGKELEYLLSLQEKLFDLLQIPYQVVKMCTGELGFPVSRKFDIEAWIPSEGKYREVTSASTTGDFQARRLNIKYTRQGSTRYVNILNATAFAIGRTIIAIMENYQQKDGSIEVPKVLQTYTGFTKIPT